MISAYFYILSLRTEYSGLQDLVGITKLGRGELYYPERNKEQKIKEEVMPFPSVADSRSIQHDRPCSHRQVAVTWSRCSAGQ